MSMFYKFKDEIRYLPLNLINLHPLGGDIYYYM